MKHRWVTLDDEDKCGEHRNVMVSECQACCNILIGFFVGFIPPCPGVPQFNDELT